MQDAYDFWAARILRSEQVAIEDFWRRFAETAPRIERYFRGLAPGFDADAELKRALGPLKERIVGDFEFGPEGGLVLVLTPELYHTRRALARAMVNAAPEIRGWKVRDARWPVARIPEAVRAILDRSRSEAMAVEAVTARRGAHRLVDIVAHGYGDREFLADQAGVIFSVLLGERADQDWLGTSTARSSSDFSLAQMFQRRPRPRNDRWLSEFRAAALSIIEAFETDRPAVPFAEAPMRVEDCVDFRLRPDGGDPARRRDAMVYQSRYPALTAARLAGVRIGSPRFSQFAEVFCGVKVRRTGAKAFSEVADIATLGARLEEALMGAEAGGVIARASGIEHVYVDFALRDVERAIPVIRRTLADERVTGPAWLLFDDAGLEDHYLPLTGKTPDTPLA